GFGSFFTKSYGSYEGRNPRTGEKVTVSSKKLPHFRPSRELIGKLNEEE
ncbi:MAG: HU family DNA-binding protein, partial [Candidatus Dadabacteria bacterium]|nr:HU family DNA-binding protein [Candidatus Dadabacteria bacterium]